MHYALYLQSFRSTYSYICYDCDVLTMTKQTQLDVKRQSKVLDSFANLQK